MFASEVQSSGSIKLRKSKVQIPPNLQHIYQYFIWAESIQTSPRQIKTNNASSHSNHDCTSKYFKPHNSKKSDAYVNMNYLTVHLIDAHDSRSADTLTTYFFHTRGFSWTTHVTFHVNVEFRISHACRTSSVTRDGNKTVTWPNVTADCNSVLKFEKQSIILSSVFMKQPEAWVWPTGLKSKVPF